MSSNQFVEYYTNQAGTGIAGFSGIRYQKGHGFFGRLLSSAVLPILKYLGKKAINTGVKIGSDVLKGENIKTSLKNQLKNTGFDMAEDAFEKIQNYKQKGSGRKRKNKTLRLKSKSTKKANLKRRPSQLQLAALAKGRNALKRKQKSKKSSKTFFPI